MPVVARARATRDRVAVEQGRVDGVVAVAPFQERVGQAGAGDVVGQEGRAEGVGGNGAREQPGGSSVP